MTQPDIPGAPASPGTLRVSGRDRAVLRAVAAGRCAVSAEFGHPLTVDGIRYADQFARERLLAAGLIATPRQAPAPAVLTAEGMALVQVA